MLHVLSACVAGLLVPSARLQPRVEHGRVRCCAAAAADPAVALFDDLLASERITHSISLRAEAGGRNLVAARDVSAGDVLLTVPKRLLLTAHRSGVIDGLEGQTELTWEAAGDLREEVGEDKFKQGARWDARLALAVFEACSGAGGPFWDSYRRLLPPPPRAAHPLTLPEPLLNELQDDDVATRIRELRARLVGLYPELDTHSCHPATAGYEAMGAPMEQIPMPLQYAYALVVSRCFAMSDGDTFAFCAFLDMADHSANPSANFASDKRGFVLRALRPIAAGDPVTICYGDDYTTSRLFEQYGFAPGEGTAQDAAWLAEITEAADAADAPGVREAIANAPATPLGSSTVGMQALGAAFEAQAGSKYSTNERRAALFDAICPDETEGKDGAGEGKAGDGDSSPKAVHPAALLAAVRWRLEAFPSSLDEDESEMSEIVEAGGSADPRVVAVLEYRLARKRLLALVEATLSTFLGQ